MELVSSQNSACRGYALDVRNPGILSDHFQSSFFPITTLRSNKMRPSLSLWHLFLLVSLLGVLLPVWGSLLPKPSPPQGSAFFHEEIFSEGHNLTLSKGLHFLSWHILGIGCLSNCSWATGLWACLVVKRKPLGWHTRLAWHCASLGVN